MPLNYQAWLNTGRHTANMWRLALQHFLVVQEEGQEGRHLDRGQGTHHPIPVKTVSYNSPQHLPVLLPHVLRVLLLHSCEHNYHYHAAPILRIICL